MENHDHHNPPADQDSEPNKAQQQPTGQQQEGQQQDQSQFEQNQQPPKSAHNPQSPETGQADYGSAEQGEGQSDTITQQRSDIEGGTSTGQTSDIEGTSSLIGSQGSTDLSSELIEDDESTDFAKDGQGATE